MADPLVQHDAVVLAAFEFIDSFDSDSEPSVHFQKPVSTSVKRRRVHTGQRIRMEIQSLRASVLELETRIEHRRQRKRRSCSHQDETTTLMSRSWRDVAKRQKAQCDRAQAENARLRALLASQTRVARKFERIATLTQRAQTSGSEAPQFHAGQSNGAWSDGFGQCELQIVS
jgi:hypothetical protein